jgi:putative ABC transport system permease protein
VWNVTIKSLGAHKLRLALTALAVVLGVAFMSGTFVLTDTIKHDINGLISQTTAGRSAVVQATTPYNNNKAGGFGEAVRPLTPQLIQQIVRSVPGVAAADGTLQGQVTLVHDGKVVKSKGQAPTIAVNWLPDRQLGSLTLRSGHAPVGAGQVVIDAATAKSSSLQVGDSVTVIGNLGPEPFTIVGIAGFGKANTLAGATITAFDTATTQSLVGKPGYFTAIEVAAAKGVPTDALLSAIGARLPAGFEVLSEATVVAQTSASIDSFINTFNTFLLFFAGIALFVGAFLIFNTFSILIGQRTRELALLRAIGASRSQVTRSVLGEATLTGLTGSVVGLLVGIPLAAGLYSLLSSFGLSVPSQGLRILPRTIIVSIVVGTLITVASVILPARRAGRVPPVAAMRDDAVLEETSLRRRAVSGGAVLAIGVLALVAGLSASNGIGLVGLGAALTFVGVAMLVPFIAAPLARTLGSPLPALQGVTGRLGRENAARNPRRTAATASALMVGLGVVGAVATLASSASTSIGSLVDRTFKADYVITSSANQGLFSTAAEPVVRAAPGVVVSSPFTEITWYEGKVSHRLSAIDAVTGPQVLNIDVVSGSTAALARGQVLVDSKVARDDHLAVGDVLSMGFAETGVKSITIGGTYKPNQLLDSYVISTALLSQNVTTRQDEAILVRTTSAGANQQAVLKSVLAAYPQLKVETGAQFKADQKKQINSFLAIVYVLLALSIIIALIGVINTLALSVLERTHEIGLLRAIGMYRRQVRRMIRDEAVVVSLIGAILGLGMGIGLGAAVVHAVSSSGIDQLAIPWGTIIVVLVAATIFGIFAAVFPARRAAKLDVLTAVKAN